MWNKSKQSGGQKCWAYIIMKFKQVLQSVINVYILYEKANSVHSKPESPIVNN